MGRRGEQEGRGERRRGMLTHTPSLGTDIAQRGSIMGNMPRVPICNKRGIHSTSCGNKNEEKGNK